MAGPGRNDQCTCGSGKKYKKCCGPKEGQQSSRLLMITLAVAMLAAIAAGVASFTGDRSAGGRVWDPAHGHYHDANGTAVP